MICPNDHFSFGRHPGKAPARMKGGTLKGKGIRASSARKAISNRVPFGQSGRTDVGTKRRDASR